MLTMLKNTRKKKRTLGLLVGLLLIGSACTPHEVIYHIFPNEIDTAHRIVRCESNYDVNAVSPTNDHGLFQINAMWNKPGHSDEVADWIGRHWNLRYDPVYNALMAKMIRDKYGWDMWSCY